MGARRGLLVYNPVAGQRDRRPAMEALARGAAARGLQLALFPTRRSGDAGNIVSEGLGSLPDLVAVAGGDGTVGEVAGALVGRGVPLAVIPSGTTNVVAREFGIGSLALAERALHSGRTAPLTVWPSSGRSSVIGTGVGFDARVMGHTVPILKRLFGRAGISWTATMEWLKYEFPPIEVTGVDAAGAPFRREATFVLSANTRRYGGDAILSPGADPGDDLLDLVLFTSRSTVDLFHFYRLLPGGRAGQLAVRGVVHFPVRSFEARSLAGYELEVQVDGDSAGETPVTVGPAAGTVQVLIP
jgi:diacylglycerol kinase family enzyme